MKTHQEKPLLAVTPGDPAGIGPEVIAGAWTNPQVHQHCRPLVVGHPELLRRAVHLLGLDIEIREVESPEQTESSAQVISCLPTGSDKALDIPPGVVSPAGGQAAYDALILASELALSDRVDGITTAPLSKLALSQAGHNWPGHTELLAELCGTDDFAMMLYLPPDDASGRSIGLGVVHVTLHMAMREVLETLSTDAVLSKCYLVNEALGGILGHKPRIAVCALNPHAGEEGLFGEEEKTIISPAVKLARQSGLEIVGPLPADTLMAQAVASQYDAVVAMYHDQGHIALKLLGLDRSVNVTLGLPIVRTSVAHGTAMDLAWQGIADPSAMSGALIVAADLARKRWQMASDTMDQHRTAIGPT